MDCFFPNGLRPDDPRFWESPGPRVLLPENEAAVGPAVLACLGRCAPEDAVVFSSSGSTGVPQLTVLRRPALLASAQMVVDWLGIGASDRLLCTLPLHHVGGFGVVARARVSGARLVLHHRRWHPGEVVDLIAREGITVVSLVPAQVFDLIRDGLEAPPCLQQVVVGGGHLATELASEARQSGWPILASFGMTEASSQIATERPGLRAPGPGWLPVIDGWETAANEHGLLRLRGPALFSGRLAMDDAGQWQYHQVPLQDGWFTTSDYTDLESHDGRTWLRPRGRSDDSIKIRGELVSLSAMQRELDGLARAHGLHPRQAAIIDVPDRRAGACLVLVIEQAAGESREALCEAFNLRAPPFARLEHSATISHLPRSPLGKLRRGELRQWVVANRDTADHGTG